MLMTRPKLRNNHFGDTIVEVMIVLAVLGLAIGISYATANRSLLNARQAQENTQATELVNAQVEQLRALSTITDSTNPNYIYRSSYFCISGGSVVGGFGSTAPILTTYANYPGSCVNSFYHLSVKYTVANDKFTVKAIWDDALGQGQDTVTFVYRLHQL